MKIRWYFVSIKCNSNSRQNYSFCILPEMQQSLPWKGIKCLNCLKLQPSEQKSHDPRVDQNRNHAWDQLWLYGPHSALPCDCCPGPPEAGFPKDNSLLLVLTKQLKFDWMSMNTTPQAPANERQEALHAICGWNDTNLSDCLPSLST